MKPFFSCQNQEKYAYSKSYTTLEGDRGETNAYSKNLYSKNVGKKRSAPRPELPNTQKKKMIILLLLSSH